MKRNTLKIIVITCLSLIGSIAYAADSKAPASKPADTATSTKATDTASATKTDDASTNAKEADVPKVQITKLKSGSPVRAIGDGRAIGNAFANAPVKAAESNQDAEKRIKELEALVAEQQKYIEMLQNQSK